MRGPLIAIPQNKLNAGFRQGDFEEWDRIRYGNRTKEQENAFRARVNVNDNWFKNKYAKWSEMTTNPRYIIPGHPNPRHEKGLWVRFAAPHVNYTAMRRAFTRRHRLPIAFGRAQAKNAAGWLALGLTGSHRERWGPHFPTVHPEVARYISRLWLRKQLNNLPKPPPWPPRYISPPPYKKKAKGPRVIPKVTKIRPMPNRYSPSNGNKGISQRWPKAPTPPARSARSQSTRSQSTRVTRSSRRSAN